MDRLIGRFDSITVFGGATIDRIAASAAPPVLGASNPGRARTSPGGVGLNVATALARLGHPVRLATRVGADGDGETIIAAAREAGVDTTFVSVSPRAPTAGYHAAFDDRGALVIGIADMGICAEMTPAALAPAAAQGPAGDLWVVDANLPASTLAFLVGEAATRGRPVAALTVSPAKAVRFSTILDRLTLIVANRREAAAVLDRACDDSSPTARDLATALVGERVPNVVVTDGPGPLIAAAGGEVRSFVPLRAKVQSVNGGGDALAAGTIHGLADGLGLFDAILQGLAAAAIAVESQTTILGRLSPTLLEARLQEAAE